MGIKWYNNQQVHDDRNETPEKISGATGFLGLTLVAGSFVQLYSFLYSGYFSPYTFRHFEAAGGMATVYSVYAEMVLDLFWLFGIGALCFWYFSKRDIFPKFFIGYVISLLIGNLVLLTLFNITNINQVSPDATNILLKQIGRTFFYGLIWIPYVLKSENVKRVFVRTR